MRTPLVIALLASGCIAPLTSALRPAPGPLSLSAPPAAARLVFVRPERLVGSGVNLFFIDGARKRLLGKAVNGTAFSVDVEPGEYLVCPLPVFEQVRRPTDPAWAVAFGVTFPATRLTVEAGRTYLLRARVIWGGRVEAVPVRPNTKQEEAVLRMLEEVRPVELVTDDPMVLELSRPESLTEWFELCLASSDDDLRLRLNPADGRAAP